MNNQERLFLAIGGADPELVARAGRKRRSRWPGYYLAAAACLALVLTVGCVFPLWTMPPAVSDVTPEPSELQDPPSPIENQKPDPNGARLVLPERGSEIGDLRLLSCVVPSQEKKVDFLIYVNEEQFSICEENGLYSIRSKKPLPDDFPECGLDILYLSGTSCDDAKVAAEKALTERYADITSEELAAALPGSFYLRAGAGTDWDSEQTELWFMGDGQGGTFVLTARYFLEAEEGLGMRFRDMVSSFQVISSNEVVPDWMRSLYETADRLFPALLSNDLSGVSDLLAEDAEPDAYGEDVWEYLSIASVDYAPDDDQDPSSATVSVKHRLNQEEGESYNYLTMELVCQNGKWLLTWSGIEK